MPDNNKYLLIKVALLIDVCGACRREKLHLLKIQDIVQKDAGCFFITISDTKTNIKRVFPVVAEGEAVNPLGVYQKYGRLQPADIEHDYFSISYRHGKCTVQRVGIHSFGKMLSIVVEFWKLPNLTEYTEHCFRRSFATLAADADIDLTSLKRLGEWRSSLSIESYIEESIEKKKKVFRKLIGEKETNKSLSSNKISVTTEVATLKEINTTLSSSGISFVGNCFEGAQNCLFHLYFAE